MRRSIRLAPLLALGLTLGFTGACRQPTTRDGRSPSADRNGRDNAKVRLPDPLPLPEQPKVASWIAQPAYAVALLEPYSPVPVDLRSGLEQAFAGLTEPALAAELASTINLAAPFSNVILDDGQEVIRLTLQSDHTALAQALAQLHAIGEFGAFTLPPKTAPTEGHPARVAARPWLVWIDEDEGSLVLANSLEGLATGRSLEAAYGQQPVFFTVDPSELPIPIELPFARVTGHGDLTAMVVEAQLGEGQDPLAQVPIVAGTLGGLLDASHIAAGVSTRYADHKSAVHDVIVEVNAAISGLPFLVRGVAEGIAAKLNTALRTWDGRVLAAIGPKNHLRIAYGASDVEKSRVAAIRLLQSVVDNVSLARNFSSRIPKMALRRKVARADGVDIELFVLHEAFSTAPELRPLVDAESRLNVAMAWSTRAGGGMIVVGPDAANELARWLEQTSSSASAASTDGQLLAASFAAEPDQVLPLLGNPNVELAEIVELSPTGPQWQIRVEDKGAGKYVIDVTTPGPAKPARAR